MQEIRLTKGYCAIIDDVDYPLVSQYKWYADVSQWNVYAKSDQPPGRPRMHVFIIQPPAGFVVNHIDRDGLNNTRDNLESMTQGRHSRLSSRRKNAKGKYRGVYQRTSNSFYAAIWVNYEKHYLGIFSSEVEAALAYNEAGKQLLGIGNFIMNEIPLHEL